MCRVVNKALSRQLTATVASNDMEEEEEQNQNANVGRIVNLVSGDSYTVSQCKYLIRSYLTHANAHRRVLV